MISTRDNLLIRPWELRKYEHHKKKVWLWTIVEQSDGDCLTVGSNCYPGHRHQITAIPASRGCQNEKTPKREREIRENRERQSDIVEKTETHHDQSLAGQLPSTPANVLKQGRSIPPCWFWYRFDRWWPVEWRWGRYSGINRYCK